MVLFATLMLIKCETGQDADGKDSRAVERVFFYITHVVSYYFTYKLICTGLYQTPGKKAQWIDLKVQSGLHTETEHVDNKTTLPSDSRNQPHMPPTTHRLYSTLRFMGILPYPPTELNRASN